MSTCELCWATFPDDDELAKHVEMEEAVDWPIDGRVAGPGHVVDVPVSASEPNPPKAGR